MDSSIADIVHQELLEAERRILARLLGLATGGAMAAPVAARVTPPAGPPRFQGRVGKYLPTGEHAKMKKAVLEAVKPGEEVTRAELGERVGEDDRRRLWRAISQLVDEGKLRQVGTRRTAYYTLPEAPGLTRARPAPTGRSRARAHR